VCDEQGCTSTVASQTSGKKCREQRKVRNETTHQHSFFTNRNNNN